MLAILGCEGFVGSMLTEVLRSSGSTYLGTSRSKIDYTNGLILRDFLLANDVKAVINEGFYTGKPNVDACELPSTNVSKVTYYFHTSH
jgi:dTDP-4-dehydrorhamnose reductase